MNGRIKFSVKNACIKFQFVLERNISIITGDSGTGKTKLINMARQYAEYGKKAEYLLTVIRNASFLRVKIGKLYWVIHMSLWCLLRRAYHSLLVISLPVLSKIQIIIMSSLPENRYLRFRMPLVE